jgi:hypothetical protein
MNKNIRFMAGMFIGIICFWVTFYLSILIWRKLLLSIGIMTKEELKKGPFYLGIENKKTKGT